MFSTVRIVARAAMVLALLGSYSQGEPPTTRPAATAPGEEISTAAGAKEVTLDELMRSCQPPSIHARKMFDLVLKAAKYDGPPIMFHACRLVDNACAFGYPGPQGTGAGAAPGLGAAPGIGLPPGAAAPTVGTPLVPVVLYNPAFMSRVGFASGNDYSCVGILAHELGHIVNGHVGPYKQGRFMHPHLQELEADRFAGMILARMGARPEELESFYRLSVVELWLIPMKTAEGDAVQLGTDMRMRVTQLVRDGQTHPNIIKRIQAISRGWQDGGGQGDVEQNLNDVFVKLVRQATRWDPGQ